jgi:hypothetical protein
MLASRAFQMAEAARDAGSRIETGFVEWTSTTASVGASATRHQQASGLYRPDVGNGAPSHRLSAVTKGRVGSHVRGSPMSRRRCRPSALCAGVPHFPKNNCLAFSLLQALIKHRFWPDAQAACPETGLRPDNLQNRMPVLPCFLRAEYLAFRQRT